MTTTIVWLFIPMISNINKVGDSYCDSLNYSPTKSYKRDSNKKNHTSTKFSLDKSKCNKSIRSLITNTTKIRSNVTSNLLLPIDSISGGVYFNRNV